LREELATRLASQDVAFDFRVQFFVDEALTPIEDMSAVWTEDASPPVTVGRLTIPAQDVTGERGRKIAARVDAMSFDPWHALVAHRPLGNVMRARNFAYRVSTRERNASGEPRAVDV
jgi:hypothetical protein